MFWQPRPWRSWLTTHWIGALFLLAAIVVSVQRLVLGKHRVFLLYREAFYDLIAGRNLYVDRSADFLDYFRYSPTFALAFAPLALLPVPVGLVLWNSLNAMALYAALRALLPERQARVAQLIVLADLVRSMQSSQMNALLTALIIAACLAYAKDQVWRGALAVDFGAFAKIFPAIAGVFALLSPARVRAVLALVAVGVVMLVLPAMVVGPAELIQQYQWWREIGPGQSKPWFSLMDALNVWTGRAWPVLPIQLAGVVLLLLPVALRRDAWRDAAWQRLLLCSLLVFSVLFNHRAETPSYIIAVSGVAIWFAAGPRTTLPVVVLALTLLLATVGTSDLTPKDVREQILEPWRAKVIPLIVAFAVMQWQLLRHKLVAVGD
jgi:hypothetical protein